MLDFAVTRKRQFSIKTQVALLVKKFPLLARKYWHGINGTHDLNQESRAGQSSRLEIASHQFASSDDWGSRSGVVSS